MTLTLSAISIIAELSIGLIKRGFIKLTECPFSSNLEQVFSAISNKWPRPMSPTSLPLLIISAFPISIISGFSLGFTPGPAPRGYLTAIGPES